MGLQLIRHCRTRILQKFFLEAEEDSESGCESPRAEGVVKAEVQSEDERQMGIRRTGREEGVLGCETGYVILDESERNRDIYHRRAS